jgi:hypothetical protein
MWLEPSEVRKKEKKKMVPRNEVMHSRQHNTAPMITNPLHLDPCKMQQARAIVNL